MSKLTLLWFVWIGAEVLLLGFFIGGLVRQSLKKKKGEEAAGGAPSELSGDQQANVPVPVRDAPHAAHLGVSQAAPRRIQLQLRRLERQGLLLPYSALGFLVKKRECESPPDQQLAGSSAACEVTK